jgi:hypothetical protein
MQTRIISTYRCGAVWGPHASSPMHSAVLSPHRASCCCCEARKNSGRLANCSSNAALAGDAAFGRAAAACTDALAAARRDSTLACALRHVASAAPMSGQQRHQRLGSDSISGSGGDDGQQLDRVVDTAQQRQQRRRRVRPAPPEGLRLDQLPKHVAVSGCHQSFKKF